MSIMMTKVAMAGITTRNDTTGSIPNWYVVNMMTNIKTTESNKYPINLINDLKASIFDLHSKHLNCTTTHQISNGGLINSTSSPTATSLESFSRKSLLLQNPSVAVGRLATLTTAKSCSLTTEFA